MIPPMSVNVEFVGHACFRIWIDGRPAIVTDPYPPARLGLPPLEPLAADTVIVSSLTDEAHSAVESVAGSPRVINALDAARGRSAAIGGEPVVTVEATEARDHPRGPQDNALYAFKAGGLWLMHMGDLGYELTAAELAPFAGKCDALFALAGQKLTPKFAELDRMFEALAPRWVLPMHYELPPLGFGMTPVEDFLAHRSHDPLVRPRHHTIELPLPSFKAGHPTLVVLEPSGYTPD